MALVAYDNSDSSDYEDEDDANPVVVTLNKKHEEPAHVETPMKESERQEDGSNLFNLLPQPSSKKTVFVEEDDEFLHKKAETSTVKSKAKISVPSLSDFKDVENSIPMSKPKAANGKKSGLLSILPQPRNPVLATTRSLIPNVLTQKPNTAKKDSVKLPAPVKKPKTDPKSLINDYSDDSDDDVVVNDFFSIYKPVEIPEYTEIPLDIVGANVKTVDDVSSTQKRQGIESFFKKDVIDDPMTEPDFDESMSEQGEATSSYSRYGSENSNGNDVALDEEAIMKLCGSRGKRKREDIQIVDVNQQEVLADARDWLLKGLMDDTTKRVSASKKKGNEFTNQQRRKHQITYLAYQAKANEAELQNQWANNRMSKRQTQAKYGF